MKFEWDQNKSVSNKAKHGVSFETAKEAFQDDHAISDQGKTVDGESRWIVIGKTVKLLLITVVFTLRDSAIRIISVRQARKEEIKVYLTHALKSQSNDKDIDD